MLFSLLLKLYTSHTQMWLGQRSFRPVKTATAPPPALGASWKCPGAESCSGPHLHAYSHSTNILQAPTHCIGVTEHPGPCLPGCPGLALQCGSDGPWELSRISPGVQDKLASHWAWGIPVPLVLGSLWGPPVREHLTCGKSPSQEQDTGEPVQALPPTLWVGHSP